MKNGEGVGMGNMSLIRTALLIALITAFGFVATGRSPAADQRGGIGEVREPLIRVVGSEASSQFSPPRHEVDAGTGSGANAAAVSFPGP